jgi:hypothetical protein
MEPPGTHQRLDGGIECPRRHPLQPETGREDVGEIGSDPQSASAGVPVQLHQITRIIEKGEPALDPAKLRQGSRRRVVALAFRVGEDLEMNRLAHRPGPPLNEPDGRADRRSEG